MEQPLDRDAAAAPLRSEDLVKDRVGVRLRVRVRGEVRN